MEVKKEELREKYKQVLLTFLKQTQEGKYAKIDKDLLQCLRYKERREESYYEEEYYYIFR